MPLYAYHHLHNKRKRRGVIDAHSEEEAKAKLHSQGFLITELALDRKRFGRALSGTALLNFTLQFKQLIEAGLPIFESLKCLEEQAPIVGGLCEEIREGKSLSYAMGCYPGSFDPLYCAMIGAGEASGNLLGVLERLGILLERRLKLRRQLITALTYPAVIAAFCLLVVFILLAFAIPSIENLFEGRQLGTITSCVLFFSHYWWLYLLLLSGAIVAIIAIFRTSKELPLKIPLLKTLIIQTEIARFSRTLATLLRGGLNMIDSLRLARQVIKNEQIERLVATAEERIIQGSLLSIELGRSPLIPSLVIQMLRVGEESGEVIPMLDRIADTYEVEVEKTLTRLTTLAQPAILIVMGGIIGIIMLAVILPLTDMSALT